MAAVRRALARGEQERAERSRRCELQTLFQKLTPRDHEVMMHVLRGQLNKQIAAELTIDERSVKRHRTSLMSKLEVQSVAELAQLMAHVQGKVQAYVLFYSPRDSGDDWQNTDLRRTAAQIPGVTVLSDVDGAEAQRLGAETSGHTFLFDPSGHLLFNGGITASRGHAGDNAGESAIVSLIDNRTSARTKTFVFGCSLKTPPREGSKCLK